MSSLQDKLSALAEPKAYLGIKEWFNSLNESEQEATWKALQEPDLKTYTLFRIFREEGLRVSKDTFVPFRREILIGSIQRSFFNE